MHDVNDYSMNISMKRTVFFFEGKGQYYLEVVQYTKLHHISKIVT